VFAVFFVSLLFDILHHNVDAEKRICRHFCLLLYIFVSDNLKHKYMWMSF